MFLIDTMVISERSKARGNKAVLQWLDTAHTESAFLSVVTISEIERGIAKFEKREGQLADRHRNWLATTLAAYSERVLPITVEIARRWGRLSHDLGHVEPDLMIAATALEHDLTVVTRNIRHFEPTGVKLFNPYGA